MDYEKKYKEAMEKFKNFKDKYCTGGDLGFGDIIFDKSGKAQEEFDNIFPELKESEDERIRKEIIRVFKGEISFTSHKENEKYIAWLEKQKTSEEALQYLKENHSPSEISDFQNAMNIATAKAYDKGIKDGLKKQGESVRENLDSEALEEEIKRWIGCEAFPEGTDITPLPKAIEIVKNTAYHFAKFQSPVEWSEEDEEIISMLIDLVEYKEESMEAKVEFIAWLKSLKDKYTWKPSDEQMKVLNEVVNFSAQSSSMRWNDYNYGVLKGLRDQLKKLKEK